MTTPSSPPPSVSDQPVSDQAALDRRGFLGSLSTGAAAIGLSMLATPQQGAAQPLSNAQDDIAQDGIAQDGIAQGDPEAWFNQIKGKHRMVFDAPRPHEILTFAWPRVFLLTNAATGTVEKECSAVVVLRHDAIPFAMGSRMWEKYKFGEVFKVNDPATQAPAVRNPFWQPKPGDFSVPGFGPVAIGINELQASGVMFCVCDAALTVNSAIVAGQMQLDPADVRRDWVSALLPGIQVVPSGLWALNRAQERGCSYCFMG